MTDKEPWFPGFEGDDEPKKDAAPAKPAAVAKPSAPVAAAPPPVPPKPAPAAVAPAKPVPAPPKPQAAAAAESDADRDLKPGSRKDLWKCPHCGAGNKPDRDSCRTCGKKQSDPIIVPWHQQTVARLGIAAAAVVIVALAIWLARTDLSLHEPVISAIDAKPRLGGPNSSTSEFGGGYTIAIEHRLSVCGRVAAVASGPGGSQMVALALGSAARDEAPAATKSGMGFTIEGGIVLACLGEAMPVVKAGQLLSVKGASGRLMKEGQFAKAAEGIIAVRVESALAK